MTEHVYAVRFAMTPHVWHTDAAAFIFKDGKANIAPDNMNPDKPLKVVCIGDEPNDAQVETIRLIWDMLKTEYGFAAASFCPAIEPRMPEILFPAA